MGVKTSELDGREPMLGEIESESPVEKELRVLLTAPV